MDLAYMYELKEEILPYFAVEENGVSLNNVRGLSQK
jgi:hypothetical protein